MLENHNLDQISFWSTIFLHYDSSVERGWFIKSYWRYDKSVSEDTVLDIMNAKKSWFGSFKFLIHSFSAVITLSLKESLLLPVWKASSSLEGMCVRMFC